MSETAAGTADAEKEIRPRQRFEFGANWARFLRSLDEDRITEAEKSLRAMLEIDNLEGQRFLDIGSGSGLFSLAARRLGATVHSFDYDPQSVACAQELKRRYFPDDPNWIIEQASVLDEAYLARLGQADIVYSWGVLHHTGRMWKALANVAGLVAPGGKLFISIYNDQGRKSRFWAAFKRSYVRHPWLRPFLISFVLLRSWGPIIVLDTLRMRGPLKSWNEYKRNRGMSPFSDVIDWAGGWPFEVATPDAIFDFYRKRGFALERLVTRQGIGCNEFVFSKPRSRRTAY